MCAEAGGEHRVTDARMSFDVAIFALKSRKTDNNKEMQHKGLTDTY